MVSYSRVEGMPCVRSGSCDSGISASCCVSAADGEVWLSPLDDSGFPGGGERADGVCCDSGVDCGLGRGAADGETLEEAPSRGLENLGPGVGLLSLAMPRAHIAAGAARGALKADADRARATARAEVTNDLDSIVTTVLELKGEQWDSLLTR